MIRPPSESCTTSPCTSFPPAPHPLFPAYSRYILQPCDNYIILLTEEDRYQAQCQASEFGVVISFGHVPDNVRDPSHHHGLKNQLIPSHSRMHDKSPLIHRPLPRQNLLLIDPQIPPRDRLREFHLRDRDRSLPGRCAWLRGRELPMMGVLRGLMSSLFPDLLSSWAGLLDEVVVVEGAVGTGGGAAHDGDGWGGGVVRLSICVCGLIWWW